MHGGRSPKLWFWKAPECIVANIKVLETRKLTNTPRNRGQFVVGKV